VTYTRRKAPCRGTSDVRCQQLRNAVRHWLEPWRIAQGRFGVKQVAVARRERERERERDVHNDVISCIVFSYWYSIPDLQHTCCGPTYTSDCKVPAGRVCGLANTELSIQWHRDKGD
jgi:hypothetical protein